MSHVTLAHGSGGEAMSRLIHELFYEAFDNPVLRQADDAAVFDLPSPLAMTTDSFVVSPLFFPGGNIGTLAACGTVNDLAMMGAEPKYLSCGFILEEGFSLTELRTIVESMAHELRAIGARIITGDTKVVPRGHGGGVYINTTGIGSVRYAGLGTATLRAGDALIVSGPIGDHGATIYTCREEIAMQSALRSDCATLWPVVAKLIDAKLSIRAMRDATRGGLAAVLHEWAAASNLSAAIEPHTIPVRPEVQGLCELLGFEPWHLANEGTFVLAVPASEVDAILQVLHQQTCCTQAACIGTLQPEHPGKVILKSEWGTKRLMEPPGGELLPRIC